MSSKRIHRPQPSLASKRAKIVTAESTSDDEFVVEDGGVHLVAEDDDYAPSEASSDSEPGFSDAEESSESEAELESEADTDCDEDEYSVYSDEDEAEEDLEASEAE